jgi:cytoskeletal protein RodZ
VKEIGEKLKETREDMGISLDEAAEDLKLRPSQIENIEAGNIEAFKDIFFLKYFIRDYSKYLGLDQDEMLDEFNEYLFDYTSKISIEEIKKAKNKLDKKEEPKKKIASPYTLENKKLVRIPSYVIYIAIGILSILIIYFFISMNQKDNFENDSIIGSIY